MSGRALVAVSGASLMAAAATIVVALVWVLATEPVGLAAYVAASDMPGLLLALIRRIIAAIW